MRRAAAAEAIRARVAHWVKTLLLPHLPHRLRDLDMAAAEEAAFRRPAESQPAEAFRQRLVPIHAEEQAIVNFPVLLASSPSLGWSLIEK